MSELKEKLVLPWPPIPNQMDPKYFNFGLSEKLTQSLNKCVYKAGLEYAKKCAEAEKEMFNTIQNFLRRNKI
jgi:hypothetical protein